MLLASLGAVMALLLVGLVVLGKGVVLSVWMKAHS